MTKPLAAVAALALFIPALPADAYSQSGGTRQEVCYNDVYREEYVPGTRDRPGRVRRWTEKERVPCRNSNPHYLPADPHPTGNYDDNSCIEGSILGGIAGGAIGGAAATQENWIWSIPAGIVGGAVIGCQVDGG